MAVIHVVEGKNMNAKTETAAKTDPTTVEEQLAQLRADIRALADTVGRQATGHLESAQETAVEKVGELEGQIRRNPLAATAIAAGVGFLLGAIVRR